jgi:D-beta-D-heptose 7-phosphate kinase/D-beta-D-heptose 1-phosphate adenosyltransferase
VYNKISHKKKFDTIDTTGCGDIVFSVIIYGFVNNLNLLKTSEIANYIAGKSSECMGNYKISINDIEEFTNIIIYDYDIETIKNIRKYKKNIIFTCGCFDIIHSAHIKLLNFAKSQGDMLIVAINSDNSVKKLKGNTRPTNNIKERCELLLTLNIVDNIIIFDKDTPKDILNILKPDLFVKGGDYNKEELVKIIGDEYKDKIILYDYHENLSSTKTINKIIENIKYS